MHVLLLGATGLVGGALLKMLEQDTEVASIYAPTRKALMPSSKLANPIDEDICSAMLDWRGPCDVAFCCLGTTRKEAGSEMAFRYVDSTLVVECAEVALCHGCQHFLVVSALGANPHSVFLYIRTKGEMERSLEMQAWQNLTIVRPSMLMGERVKPRLLEQISEPIFKHLPEKWKTIDAVLVAKTMLQAAHNPPSYRLQIIESDEMQHLHAFNWNSAKHS